VLAVISDGETVVDVAGRFGVRRQTDEWLAWLESGGLGALVDQARSMARCWRAPLLTRFAVQFARLSLTRPTWMPRASSSAILTQV
jgi:hypothetical protein